MFGVKKIRSLAVIAALVLSAPVLAAGGGQEKPPRVKWSFSGPFGTFDQAQVQRGFKVYREVCAACHSISGLSFRNLSEEGGPAFSKAQIQALAAEYKVKDGPNEQGEMFERAARPSDRIPSPHANPEAAKAANGGAMPPDFTVIAKARTYERGFPTFVFDIFTQYQEQGPDYITALLNGYADAPKGVTVEAGLNYNKYFPGNKIAMGKPLSDKQVDYTDGSPQTVEQYAKDVSAFLMWSAEPHLNKRKQVGFFWMSLLGVLALLLLFTKKKIWKRLDQDHAHA